MRARSEDGAIAVMTAIMAVLLFSFAALAVDLGRAQVEKRDIQATTDFAALAGAGEENLPGTTPTSCAYGPQAAVGDQAVQDAAAFLGSGPWAGAVSAALLRDCNLQNGEVVYGTLDYSTGTAVLDYDEQTLTLVSPPEDVSFGLAGIMGFSGTTVRGVATVAAGTPGSSKTFPAYAVDGCDWGLQTITNPANGQAANYSPTLVDAADNGNRVKLTVSSTASPNPSPNTIPVGTVASPLLDTIITISGSGLDEATKLGLFFEADGSTPAGKIEIDPYSATNPNGFTLVDASTIRLTVSSARYPSIANTNRVLWVRVKGQTTGNASSPKLYSEVSNAQPLRVGNAYLRCTSGSNQGNYGALILPRADSTNSASGGWMPRNIATNLDEPLSLHTYPGSPTREGETSTAPDLCDPSDMRSVYSPTSGNPTESDLLPETNCVDTDPGLPATSVSAGLVEGVGNGAGFIKGRLTDEASDCGRSARTVTLTGNRNFDINDDVLTCFMQPGVTVGTIWSSDYAGPAVISCEIYDSPRFFYQPVLQTRPDSGASQHYSVVDFRPAFIANQGSAAINGSGPATTDNGVRVNNGAVDQINVIFFSNNALEKSCTNSVGPALGGTTLQALRMVN